MARSPHRSPGPLGITLVIVACGVSYASAASLGGISSAGLSAWTLPATIVGDVTPPTITASIAPAPNSAGWNRTAVTVTFLCSDAESGVASCTSPVPVTGEGAGQAVVGHAADRAGNVASTTATVNIDLTPPVVRLFGVTDGDVLAAPPTVRCSATDALSGIAGACSVVITSGADGRFTATAMASDVAGNVATATASYRILAVCGIGPPDVPCVVPAGTTLDRKLDWRADVLVLGTVTKKIDVEGGSVTVGSTGIVDGDIRQRGDGGITVLDGGVVDGKIKEEGAGSVVVDGAVSKDVEERGDGDLTVGPAGVVDGKVKEEGAGSVVVDGAVSKDVEESGDGDLTVGSAGVILGKVKEEGAGSVVVDGAVRDSVDERGDGDLTIGAAASVAGTVKEFDDGSLTVNGRVTSDVAESDAGDLIIGAGALLDRKATESGPGSVTVAGRVALAVAEQDAGDLTLLAGAAVGGDVTEAKAGNLTIDGPSTIGGHVIESDGGDLTIGSAVIVGGNADSAGDGTCTISTAATISGKRLHQCARP